MQVAGLYGEQAWGVELRKHSRVHGKYGVWSYYLGVAQIE